ncbi:MAG TPA: sulfurtransferase [Gammaproteobacteria bacterium]|nr:sulfurtransferase [Gammaproteobacteria bacterium]
MPWLINAQQVDSFRKNQKNLVILDATWHGQDSSKAKQEFLEKHIPGARFFDINLFSDTNTSLPNFLLLDENQLAEKLSHLGLRNDCKIIIYDNSASHSSCRALWMFKMFGHSPQLLYILDGGLSAWEKYGGKTEEGEVNTAPKLYPVNLQEKYLRTLSQIKMNMGKPQEQIIDTRHAVRFSGGPEPRPGLRSGHIPGSFNFPSSVVFDKEGFFLPIEKLRRRLEGLGVDVMHPTITSCGSGMSAPVINFVLDILGNENNAVYNGSWTEWGAEKPYPGEKDLSERPISSCI